MNSGAGLLWPGAWPLLLLAPAVWIAATRLDRVRRRRLLAWIGPRVAALAGDLDPVRRRARRVWFAAGVAFVGFAVLQPTWGARTTALEPEAADVVVALDVSRSMLAEDVSPSRLASARSAIRALAEHVQGDRLALVAFAGEARRIVPLTKDAATFAELVDRADPLAVARGGTDLGAAIETATAALTSTGDRRGVVVLVTDGEDLGGRGLAASRAAAERGVQIHCVGVGSERGAKIPLEERTGARFLRDPAGHDVVSAMDEDGLARVAAAAGGTFVVAGDDERVLCDLYDDHVRSVSSAARRSPGGGEGENRYQWPLLIGILLLVIELGTSDRRRA